MLNWSSRLNCFDESCRKSAYSELASPSSHTSLDPDFATLIYGDHVPPSDRNMKVSPLPHTRNCFMSVKQGGLGSPTVLLVSKHRMSLALSHLWGRSSATFGTSSLQVHILYTVYIIYIHIERERQHKYIFLSSKKLPDHNRPILSGSMSYFENSLVLTCRVQGDIPIAAP